VRLESLGGQVGQRRMRIAVINDDMPFLVDSVAAAVTQFDIVIHRLLHPVAQAVRDADGSLLSLDPEAREGSQPESIIYMEVDRADARTRRDLFAELHRVLADVRCAVSDWKTMQQQMRSDAALVDDPEGRELLSWFADGAMTLLGYQVERPGQPSSNGLGVFRVPSPPDEEGGSESALRYFREGGQVPLVAKAERKSTVHRRVPLDLIVVPIRENGEITAIGVHAGLWTSQALSAPVEAVPLLRRHLSELEASLGFDPSGHSGKAMRHAISSLPHDLLVNLDTECIRHLVLTAMSLADRPRSTLGLVRSTLRGHLFAFVWLPRDELTTRRRVEIGDMIAKAAGGKMTSWSVALATATSPSCATRWLWTPAARPLTRLCSTASSTRWCAAGNRAWRKRSGPWSAPRAPPASPWRTRPISRSLTARATRSRTPRSTSSVSRRSTAPPSARCGSTISTLIPRTGCG
jgi:glutamate dehydrogenase